jgi:putative endopeptidase
MTRTESLAVSAIFAVVMIFSLASCTNPPASQAPSSPQASGGGGIDSAGMDTAVKPGDDFFRYANGQWLKSTEIPQDRSSYGADEKLTEEANQRTRELMDAASKSSAPAGSDERKIGDYFAAYMNEGAIETKGLSELRMRLDQIAAIKDRRSLAQSLGQTIRADVDPLNNTNFYTQHLFGIWVAQDFNQPTRNVPYLLQGGIGLPDREYYLDSSPRMSEIRTKYKLHIATVLKLAGIADADAKAEKIYSLENKIAKAHWSRTDSQEVLKANNPWKREEFAAKAPGLDWKTFFEAAGLAEQPLFIVWQPSAVTGESSLAGSEPLDTWKDYLTFQFIDGCASLLPKAFVEERFNFYGKVLSGTPQLRERWKRAVDSTNFALGDAVGRMYVQRYFAGDAKAKAESMVADLVKAFGQRIENLAWMSPQTKAKAKEKLATLKVGVGYPAEWQDYSGLNIARDSALHNLLEANLYQYHRSLAKIGKPVDRSEWWMTPQTVNAVNLPVQNALNFPAAILQPPYFDPKADPALNYGAIGAVIGHEISHSFDDQGSQFDAAGKLSNWWTPADFSHFKEVSSRLVAQYDAYHPFPDLSVNGRQTLSENIADIAGLSVAYDGYRLSLGGKPAPVIQGFTGDQRFFLSFAQAWREKFREQLLRQIIVTDGHSPSEYRADAVRNIDAWYSAFEAKPGQTLYLSPSDRVRLW